ncbi:MAG: FliM/FliN family flagellar motor C-terminal domain-containing protein [Polyangiaceae bacterium]
MSQPRPTPYPWNALESVSRTGARRAARARRQVQAVLDVPRLRAALAALTESEASLVVRRVGTEAPRRRPLTELGFELGAGTVCALSVEPELATNALSRVLRRPVTLSSHEALDDSLSGALTALVLEFARRAGAQETLSVLEPGEARARATDVFVEATVLLDDTPYQVLVALGLPEVTQDATPPLSVLGELAIELPLVVGCGLAERATLADFTPGNAWFPGTGLWLDAHLEGQIVLAAASHDRGLSGTLSRNGKIVLRGESVQLLPDAGELMSDPGKPEASLSDAVLDSPVVVRVEVGAVTLTAREWAELGPGDVIETGRRIAEPVILRVAGREVARGELVNLEGEIGVRIRELVRS